MVAVRVGGKVKIIRFGAQGMGHNYSPEARRSFKARHRRNIAKGKSSAAYWANKVFWAGKGGSKKMPPKSQKYTRGLKRRKKMIYLQLILEKRGLMNFKVHTEDSLMKITEKEDEKVNMFLQLS